MGCSGNTHHNNDTQLIMILLAIYQQKLKGVITIVWLSQFHCWDPASY